MTISQAFNEIAVAQGGTANNSGTIAGAIDALNDALAGSDQEAAQTIEEAVRLLGSHIGGGASVTVESLTATENKTYTAPEGKAYSPVTVNVSGGSSDFTIAHVEMTSNSVNQYIYAVANLFDGEMLSLIDSEDMDGSTFDIVLYKGSAHMIQTDGSPAPEATVTGDVEVNAHTGFNITGDGTITLVDGNE